MVDIGLAARRDLANEAGERRLAGLNRFDRAYRDERAVAVEQHRDVRQPRRRRVVHRRDKFSVQMHDGLSVQVAETTFRGQPA